MCTSHSERRTNSKHTNELEKELPLTHIPMTRIMECSMKVSSIHGESVADLPLILPAWLFELAAWLPTALGLDRQSNLMSRSSKS